MVDTLAASDPKIPVAPRGLRQKGIDEGGLADPRLPRHKHQLAVAQERLLQGLVQLRQLFLPADEAGRRLQGRRNARFTEARDGRGGGERGDEPVAPSARRLDEARVLGVVPKRAPQLADITPQQSLTDIAVLPDGLQQFLLGEQPLRMLGEIAQEQKRLRPQGQKLTPAPESLVREVQPKGRKGEVAFVHHRTSS